MATLIDLTDLSSRSKDIGELRSLLRRLVGKPFQFFRASYDDELTLHLGPTIAYPGPKMKGLRKGSFLLASQASAWVLEPASPPARILTSDGIEVVDCSGRARLFDLDEIESEETIRPGSLVSEATASPSPTGLILSLTFSDGSTLVLIPKKQDEEEEEGEPPLSDWEIYMPGGRLLMVGPGEVWSYVDSRIKPSEAADR